MYARRESFVTAVDLLVESEGPFGNLALLIQHVEHSKEFKEYFVKKARPREKV